MQKQTALVLLCLAALSGLGQQSDSVYRQLQEVEIKPVSKESELRLLSSEGMINRNDLQKQSSYSLLPAVNNVPGVRMEERSPGSYRLSIRGSLLRSPFGVRNVKIYLGDLPFTDAGGNTYLSSLDIAGINGLRILKGPEASIFGANTGGVVLIDPVYKSTDSLKVIAALSGGSYGLFHENVLVQKRDKNSLFTLNQGYQRADGYRQNSAMQRYYAQLAEAWSYHPKAQLRFLALYSDLNYQTPGGLTLQQFQNNPAQARPGTAALPGAVQQKAAVDNKTIFGGVTHDINMTSRTRHVISIFGSHTDFKNPFITNYEQRTENTLGARTYFEGSAGDAQNFGAKWNLGSEWSKTNSTINNYGNNRGTKDTIQAADKLNAQQAFLFARFLMDIHQKILIELSASYNFFSYRYKNIFPFAETSFNRNTFDPQFMPRLAVSYKITANISWRASASRGYSPPTLAEIRSSDNTVNKNLQAETGLSYETGLRLRDDKDYFWIDASVFYYRLTNAIVRRTHDNGTEYFINAGGTKQPGLEAQLSLWLLKPRSAGVLRSAQLKGNITYNQFTFGSYHTDAANYSGNHLTGVPDYTSMESINLEFPFNLSLYAQYYYSAAIPLNDSNTAYAKAYQLVQVKAEWKKTLRKLNLYVFGGVDNLLNETYSLGNDLNAAGNRYYNAAAPRNYYAGLRTEF